MNDVDALMREYLRECTPDEVMLRELVPASSSTRVRRRPRALMPIVASVTAAALIVVGVVVAREQLAGPVADVPPVDVALGTDAAELLGTWVVLGQASADPADLERQVRVTFLPDGTVGGWDGCNSVGGTYRVDDDGLLAIAIESTTDMACVKRPDATLPVGQDLRFEPATNRITLYDAQGEEVSVLWRPGGQYNPTAVLRETETGDIRLELTTWGGGLCPYVPLSVNYPGRNQITIDRSFADQPCHSLVVTSTRSVAVDASRIDTGTPLTVTLDGLYSAPVTVPVDVLQIDSGPPQTIEIGVVLVDQGDIDSDSPTRLVTYLTRVDATGDTGWDAVNALLTTVASDGKASNGFNFGYAAAWPIAEVNTVTVDRDLITVDLDRDVWDPSAADCFRCVTGPVAMQQLVWTLNGALETDLPVLLTVNGEPARGIMFYRLDGPVEADPSLEPSGS